MADYRLKCLHPSCGREFDDTDTYRLRCDAEIEGVHGPSLLRAEYEADQLLIRDDLPGLFRYVHWLPVGPSYVQPEQTPLGRPLCYRSVGLANRLGLKNLYVAFSGYWPERGGNLLTRTFKEFECQATIARYLRAFRDATRPLLVSSAGNTANGFNMICSLLGLPIYLVVPESGLDKLVLPFKTHPFTVAVRGDYSDAIALADAMADKLGLLKEGGVRNVARRAGMATVMLHAVADPQQGSQRLYDHYFQAVGSASGAIAAREAVDLLRADGRFGTTMTQIHMAQNAPFTPIADSWEAGERKPVEVPEQVVRDRVLGVTARVLTNRTPPYEIHGGIYDVLNDTGGAVWRVDNYRVFHAARMFEAVEGIDIGPAAAVAVDALQQAVESGRVGDDEMILLHVTGGGKEIQYAEGPVHRVDPTVRVEPGDLARVLEAVGEPAVITDPRDRLICYD